jgi:hypothetical protein
LERCSWYIPTDKRGGKPILISLTNVTSTSHFEGRNKPMKTPKRLIDVELEFDLHAYDIERLVEATRILMEALGVEVDTEGDTEI